MSELSRPFVRLWNWVDQVGGFPGKMLFIMLVILLILGFFMWLNNRKAG
jgi:hypothetical protein